MNSPWKAALAEAYASARSDVVYLETLQISNPDLVGGDLWLVKDRQDHDLKLETGVTQHFTATAFRMSLPASGENGLQDLNIAVDNTDRRLSDFITAVSGSGKPVEVTYRPYLYGDNSGPQLDPPLVLFLTDLHITAVEVSGRATFADILNRKFATDFYVRRRFPAL